MTPVCLPPASHSPAPGSVARVTGFGTTSEAAEEPSPRLLGVEVRVISLAECRASNSVYGAKLVSSMLCAGDSVLGGRWVAVPSIFLSSVKLLTHLTFKIGPAVTAVLRDACKRDSGGPLVQSLGGAGAGLVGVVSWGQGCGQARYPGVYTRYCTVLHCTVLNCTVLYCAAMYCTVQGGELQGLDPGAGAGGPHLCCLGGLRVTLNIIVKCTDNRYNYNDNTITLASANCIS